MHFTFTLPLLALAASTLAVPHEKRQFSTAPTATVKNGTVVGSTSNGIDGFLGIPFALPPTGHLRLRPPHSYNHTYPGGTLTATSTPQACPQFYVQQPAEFNAAIAASDELLSDVSNLPYFSVPDSSGEDCLTLNVQRPSGTTSSSKLPVVFWIYGGGFEFGSTQSYDGSNFIAEGVSGVAAGHPVVYVAINYRVSGFGFLAGKQLQREGSTNLGLRDQRLALKWVAENIEAFGGDPSKVTIWGESAGSISVFNQLIIDGGNIEYQGQPLFRAAIMDSGSVVPAEPVNTTKAQVIFDQVVQAAGCSSAKHKLHCLRHVDYGTLQAAITSVPSIVSYQSLDLSYLPRPDPHDSFFPMSPDDALLGGHFARVPIIIGDQEDEGTLFALEQTNISTTAELITYLQSYFPVSGAQYIPALVATYPDDPAAGSPFGTGDLYNIYPQYKRLAAILGDITFTLVRRSFLYGVAAVMPSWSYLDSHLNAVPILGTFHATDTFEAYQGVPYPAPAATYRSYYTAFAYYLNPNGIGAGTSSLLDPSPLIDWPQYNTSNPQLLHILPTGNGLLADTFREAQFQELQSLVGKLKV